MNIEQNGMSENFDMPFCYAFLCEIRRKSDHVLRAEPAGFLHAVVKSGAEAVAAYRLKALAKADNDRVDEKHKTADNGHGRNRSVTIRLTHKVHQDRSHTGNSLTS